MSITDEISWDRLFALMFFGMYSLQNVFEGIWIEQWISFLHFQTHVVLIRILKAFEKLQLKFN